MKQTSKIILSLLPLALLFIFENNAVARKLAKRPGLGFTNQFVVGSRTPNGIIEDKTVPALSFRYHFNQQYGAALALGFDNRNDDNILALGAKIFYIIFEEDYLNFYGGASLGLVSFQESDFQGTLLIGSEFFFNGLPSLGFSTETGIRLDKTSGTFGVSTIGDSFFIAGIHFYI